MRSALRVVEALESIEGALKQATEDTVAGGADFGRELSDVGPINSFWRKTREVLGDDAAPDVCVADLAEQISLLRKHVEMIRRGIERCCDGDL